MQTIKNLKEYTFQALLNNSVKLFKDRPALSFVSGDAITYKEFYDRIQEAQSLLKSLGVRPGDKVAILAPSSPYWAISYFSIVTMGAVAVPLLPDLNSDEACTCLEHSESKAVFVYDKFLDKVKNAESLKLILNIADHSVIKNELEIADENGSLEGNNTAINTEDSVASIIYTSGTTGKPKGVVLTNKNLVFTAIGGQNCQRINKYDKALSILPMSHVYEFSIGFLMFLLNGACIYYLEQPPIPRFLLPALQKVKPNFMLAVPLIIEKIYKQKIVPAFSKDDFTKKLYANKVGRKILQRVAGRKLKKTFGGRIKFFGLGGAKTDPEIEEFMKSAKFPYAIGYGLTETSPLVAFSSVRKTIPGVLGIQVPGVDVKILDPNPETGVGELCVKGPNVMKGYYKAPELTKSVFTEDGWFKTGDLCCIDKKGRISLRGRSKNLILSPAGENIYPEDIEFVLNQHPLVSEALVVEGENTSIVAYVKLNEKVSNFSDAIMQKKEQVLNEIKFHTNSKVNKFSKIDKVELVDEFEKTASQKIKRYLYFFNKNKTES